MNRNALAERSSSSELFGEIDAEVEAGAMEVLTPRERGVLILWRGGMDGAGMAARMRLSPEVVKATLARARRRIAIAEELLGGAAGGGTVVRRARVA